MTYKFISSATSKYYSHLKYIWFNKTTNTYYLTNDPPDIIANTTNKNNYMLIKPKPEPVMVSNTKDNLLNIIRILTNEELVIGKIMFDGSEWIITNNKSLGEKVHHNYLYNLEYF
jgi:hypothetical protein